MVGVDRPALPHGQASALGRYEKYQRPTRLLIPELRILFTGQIGGLVKNVPKIGFVLPHNIAVPVRQRSGPGGKKRRQAGRKGREAAYAGGRVLARGDGRG